MFFYGVQAPRNRKTPKCHGMARHGIAGHSIGRPGDDAIFAIIGPPPKQQ
jgi:hypothetical protein